MVYYFLQSIFLFFFLQEFRAFQSSPNNSRRDQHQSPLPQQSPANKKIHIRSIFKVFRFIILFRFIYFLCHPQQVSTTTTSSSSVQQDDSLIAIFSQLFQSLPSPTSSPRMKLIYLTILIVFTLIHFISLSATFFLHSIATIRLQRKSFKFPLFFYWLMQSLLFFHWYCKEILSWNISIPVSSNTMNNSGGRWFH